MVAWQQEPVAGWKLGCLVGSRSAELSSNTVSWIIHFTDVHTWCSPVRACVCVCTWQWKRYRPWWTAVWAGWWPASRREEGRGRCLCPGGLRHSAASTVTRCTAVRVSLHVHARFAVSNRLFSLASMHEVWGTDAGPTSAVNKSVTGPQMCWDALISFSLALIFGGSTTLFTVPQFRAVRWKLLRWIYTLGLDAEFPFVTYMWLFWLCAYVYFQKWPISASTTAQTSLTWKEEKEISWCQTSQQHLQTQIKTRSTRYT